MDLKLSGKTALVTGSTNGIGFAIAKQLMLEGVKVVINGRSQGSVDKALSQLKAIEPEAAVTGVAADFAVAAEVEALIQQVPAVDILVNNVGIFQPVPFTEIPDSDWMKFFEVNVLSGVRLSRHYFPQMLEKNEGRIIFISSESAVHIPEEMIHYGMTKTAQLAVSRGLAELTKGTGVTVNSILPGPTRSGGVGAFLEELGAKRSMTTAEVEKDFFVTARPTSLIKRFLTPDEVASFVVYIASPLSSATNGAALRADGGLVKSIL